LFVAIEGPIGVGKTSAVRLLSEALHCETLFEIVEENPFLKDFYQDRDAWALQCETFFLLNRLNQLENVGRRLLAGATVVADYHIMKNRLFADITLSADRREKYMQVFEVLTSDLPKPDIVVQLKAEHATIMERIRRRDRPFERTMDPEYIRRLMEMYDRYLAPDQRSRHIGQADLLVVDTTHLDLVRNQEHQRYFIDLVKTAMERRRAGMVAQRA
jgi:deoxyguanosine kinase